jgi:hypothetical protein
MGFYVGLCDMMVAFSDAEPKPLIPIALSGKMQQLAVVNYHIRQRGQTPHHRNCMKSHQIKG